MADRMSREEFLGKLAPLDDAALRKVLWTLYWRGPVAVRQRIEDLTVPERGQARRAAASASPDAAENLALVQDFAELARSGAYLGRDRRVTPTERTKWRFTFKRLVDASVASLRGEDLDSATLAVGTMIELAREADHTVYFHSEDPVEAAKFVVSDAVESLWSATRHRLGWDEFCVRAAPQLVRWEARYGWTRTGFGAVSDRERSLASVLAAMLPNADTWDAFSLAYVASLDAVVGTTAPHGWRSVERERADNLAEWHGMLLDRLFGTEHEHVLDAIGEHPALAGPERTFVAARLAHLRGDDATARTLIHECTKALPGHTEFQGFAASLK